MARMMPEAKTKMKAAIVMEPNRYTSELTYAGCLSGRRCSAGRALPSRSRVARVQFAMGVAPLRLRLCCIPVPRQAHDGGDEKHDYHEPDDDQVGDGNEDQSPLQKRRG